jgi:hypothetical protein
MGVDKRALWFAVGLGATAGLILILMVMISNSVQGAPQTTTMYLVCAAVPLAWLSGFGLGRGRNN